MGAPKVDGMSQEIRGIRSQVSASTATNYGIALADLGRETKCIGLSGGAHSLSNDTRKAGHTRGQRSGHEEV